MSIDKTIFERYASLKKQINELETQANELKPVILKDLKEFTKDLEEKNVRFTWGTFSLTERKLWKYTEEVNKLKNELTDAMSKEQESGVAIVLVEESLRFTP